MGSEMCIRDRYKVKKMKYSSYHGAHAAGFSLYDNKPRLSTCLSAFLKVGEDMSMIIFKLGPI